MTPPIPRGAAVLLLSAGLLAGCSRGDSTSTPSPGEPLTVITVSRQGASPRNIVVPRGTQVTFVNEDNRVHEMYSDPHPEHTDCPEFDTVGSLQPGQTRQTTNLVDAGTCNFHDHRDSTNSTLRGSVTIQ